MLTAIALLAMLVGVGMALAGLVNGEGDTVLAGLVLVLAAGARRSVSAALTATALLAMLVGAGMAVVGLVNGEGDTVLAGLVLVLAAGAIFAVVDRLRSDSGPTSMVIGSLRKPIGEFAVCAALAAICVVAASLITNHPIRFSIPLAAVAGFLGLRLLGRRRIVIGLGVLSGTIVATSAVLWRALALSEQIPRWTKAVPLVVLLPVAKLVLNRIVPQWRERSEAAKVWAFGTTRIGASWVGDRYSELQVTNRSAHEIRNVHLLYPGQFGPASPKVADLLLPGESSDSVGVGKWGPPPIEVLFEDWRGDTWTHRRTIIPWYTTAWEPPPEERDEWPADRFWEPGRKPRDKLSIAFIRPLDLIWDVWSMSRGLLHLGLSVDEYLKHRLPSETYTGDPDVLGPTTSIDPLPDST